jgi:hypothetical protein
MGGYNNRQNTNLAVQCETDLGVQRVLSEPACDALGVPSQYFSCLVALVLHRRTIIRCYRSFPRPDPQRHKAVSA